MANNGILFNAAFSGALGAINASRSIASASGAAYTGAVASANAFATLLDAAIPAANYTQQEADLLQSICVQLFAQKGGASTDSVLLAAVIAIFNQARTSLVAIPDYGAQASWAIDPTLGNDSNVGTPASPLRTMAEFSKRMTGVLINQTTTLQLVGNVLDSAMQLSGTRFGLLGFLDVLGTLTDTASGLVSASVAVGPGWQITTTGINWTLQSVSSQVRFSTGQVAAIAEIVDANNVIVGSLYAISGGAVTPTNGSTVTVATRSQIVGPNINAISQQLAPTPSLRLQNLTIASANPLGAWTMAGGARIVVFGCEQLVQATIWPGSLSYRASRFTITSTFAFQSQPSSVSTIGCVVAGTGSTVFSHQMGMTQHTNLLMTGARMGANGANTFVVLTGVHIRNTAGPVLNNSNATMELTGGAPAITGSVGNTGIGIDCASGRVTYFSSSKPTVTGASDCRVGGVAKTYAQIPFINYDATVPAAITGNGAAITLSG